MSGITFYYEWPFESLTKYHFPEVNHVIVVTGEVSVRQVLNVVGHRPSKELAPAPSERHLLLKANNNVFDALQDCLVCKNNFNI